MLGAEGAGDARIGTGCKFEAEAAGLLAALLPCNFLAAIDAAIVPRDGFDMLAYVDMALGAPSGCLYTTRFAGPAARQRGVRSLVPLALHSALHSLDGAWLCWT